MNEQPLLDFDGETFETQHDAVRLTGQCLGVFRVMAGGEWLTLEEISRRILATEASISARLRDFRKPKFGSHTVDRRRRHPASAGVFEYRLTVNRPAMDAEIPTAFQM